MKNTRVGILLLAAASSSASAFDWGFSARGGYIYSDNVTQGPVPASADILDFELRSAVAHTSRTLLLDAEGTYRYRYFPNSEYDSEATPQLRAGLEWAPFPDRLRLNISDTYGQFALNPAEGLLPSELENANVFSAGPTFILPLSLDTRISLGGEYRIASFETAPVDTIRRTGELRFERDLSRLVALFVSGINTRVKPDEGVAYGYEVNSLVAGFDGVGRRSALTFDAGVSRLDNGEESFTGSTYDLTLERSLSANTRLYLSAEREITDTADVFSLDDISDTALAGIRDIQVTEQPMQRDEYRVGYERTAHRLAFTLTAGYRKEDFRFPPASPASIEGVDRTIRDVVLEAEYELSPRNSFLLRGDVAREKFVTGVQPDDLLFTLGWLRRLTPRLGLDARVQSVERSNSPRDFEEFRLFVHVRYVARELFREADPFDRAFERRIRRLRGTDQAEGRAARPIPRPQAPAPSQTAPPQPPPENTGSDDGT